MRIDVQDEDLRTLCVVAGVEVVNDPCEGYFVLRRRLGPTSWEAALGYDATRPSWEAAIRTLIEKSTAVS